MCARVINDKLHHKWNISKWPNGMKPSKKMFNRVKYLINACGADGIHVDIIYIKPENESDYYVDMRANITKDAASEVTEGDDDKRKHFEENMIKMKTAEAEFSQMCKRRFYESHRGVKKAKLNKIKKPIPAKKPIDDNSGESIKPN